MLTSLMIVGCSPVNEKVIVSEYCDVSSYLNISDSTLKLWQAAPEAYATDIKKDKDQIKVHNRTYYCQCESETPCNENR